MINWEASKKLNNKSIEWLQNRFNNFPNSHFKVVAICDKCGRERIVSFSNSGNLCRRCGCAKRNANPKYIKNRLEMYNSDSWKKNNKIAAIKTHNDKDWVFNQKRGAEKMAQNPDWIKKNKISIEKLHKLNLNNPTFGERVSAGLQHIPYNEWEGYCIDNNYNIPSHIYDEWRRAVYKRDNHTCKICGKDHCMIHAHHIIPKRINQDLILDINNGITMCKTCHELTYGKEVLFIEELQMMINGEI